MRTLLIAAVSLFLLGSSDGRFPQCPRALEPSLARVETGSSEHRLAEELVVQCSDGRPYVLLPSGTRLPASYENRFVAGDMGAEEVRLHFQGMLPFISRKLHKAPGGYPHMKATIRVDEAGQVTLTEWDPDKEVAISIGKLRVEKAGGQ